MVEKGLVKPRPPHFTGYNLGEMYEALSTMGMKFDWLKE